MPIAKRLLPLFVALSLAGCAGLGPYPYKKQRDAPLIAEANERFRNGDFSGASQIYQRLAEQSGDTNYYRLLAADAELREGNDRAARALLGAIDVDELEEGDQQRYALLRCRLDLNQGKAREAMALLDGINYQRLTTPLRMHYHTLRASAYNQLGDMLQSARERVYYGQLINNPEAIQKNNDAIYDALDRLPPQVLADLQPSTQGTLGGWMALVIALHSPEANRAKAVQTWQSRYPGHPANGAFVASFLNKMPKAVELSPLKPAEAAPPVAQPPAVPQEQTPPATSPTPVPQATGGGFIGVMLPLSGQYGLAGQAVRTGLSAAWNADTNAGKPELRFADTQGGDVGAIYQKFASEGARFVIGPLTKDEVGALGKLTELPVPVLALNQIPELGRERLYQFALTPEEEVEQAVSLAWFDGRQNALVLAPASAFGQRMINHFSNYWKSLGGKIDAIKTYQPGAADYSDTAKQLLASAAGGDASAGQSGPEFIFLIADSRDGRLLNPHIQNQVQNNIPVYATSFIFNGQTDAPQNNDLTGVTFCDSPWLLNTVDNSPLSRQALQAMVKQTPEVYLRLLPMGIDAYQLLPELGLQRGTGLNRFNGATGTLTLRTDKRVQRQLHCAQFAGSALQPRGIAPTLQPGSMPTPP